MSTDRPDITDSTDIVGRSVWQIETGVSFESDLRAEVSHHEWTMPQAMLRVGVSDRVEVRISGDGVLTDSIATMTRVDRRTRVTGGSDLEVGAKWKLADRPLRGFLFALEPVLSIPTGSGGFTSGGYDPTLKVIADRDLPGRIAMSANLVLSWVSDERQRVSEQSVSGSFARAFGDTWSGFAEIYRASATAPDGATVWIADVGAMRAVGTRVQIDVSVGRGFSDAAPDWFIGAGVAFRGVPAR